jgi:hypothetical protein
MKSLNHSRGNETPDHRKAKPEFRRKALMAGFSMVLCEKRNCDVIAMVRSRGHIYTLGMEYERSVRNILRNAARCRALGCHDVLIVCSDHSVADGALRMVARMVNHEERQHIHIIGRSELTVDALRNFRVRNGGVA